MYKLFLGARDAITNQTSSKEVKFDPTSEWKRASQTMKQGKCLMEKKHVQQGQKDLGCMISEWKWDGAVGMGGTAAHTREQE